MKVILMNSSLFASYYHFKECQYIEGCQYTTSPRIQLNQTTFKRQSVKFALNTLVLLNTAVTEQIIFILDM